MLALGALALTIPLRFAEAAQPLADELAQRTLFELKAAAPEIVESAFLRIERSGDRRFIAPLIELLRADMIPIVEGFERKRLVEVLEKLSGERYGGDWGRWLLWWGEQVDLPPPPGFVGWKGSLYSRIDPAFGALLPLGIPTRIPIEEIVWGGVGFEGIPALDAPATIPAREATYLSAEEPVFGVALGGEARAYPLRILDWHELANDRVGGVPISLAYCTLCGSGIVYDRRGADGTAYDFGSSGLLMRSNKLMVDRQTRSLWNQMTGEPVVGPLVDGPRMALKVLPSVVTTWGDWKRRHPETTVLALETGHDRPYELGAAYADYFSSEGLMFPVRSRNRAVPPKTRVFALRDGSSAKAWTLDVLAKKRVLHDRVGSLQVLLVASGEQLVVDGKSARSGQERRYLAGLEVRAYRLDSVDRTRSLRFRADPEGVPIDAAGRRWAAGEASLVGPDGQELPRMPGVSAYWFGWAAYHPHSEVVTRVARDPVVEPDAARPGANQPD